MSQSGSGTPTLGRSEQRMAHRDDEEQLPSNNDTASLTNGTTSNLLSLSSNNPNKTFLLATSSCSRRNRGDGNDLHDSNIGNHIKNASSVGMETEEEVLLVKVDYAVMGTSKYSPPPSDFENADNGPDDNTTNQFDRVLEKVDRASSKSYRGEKNNSMILSSINESIHTSLIQDSSTTVPRRTSKRLKLVRDVNPHANDTKEEYITRRIRKVTTMPLASNESIHTIILQNRTNVIGTTEVWRKRVCDEAHANNTKVEEKTNAPLSQQTRKANHHDAKTTTLSGLQTATNDGSEEWEHTLSNCYVVHRVYTPDITKLFEENTPYIEILLLLEEIVTHFRTTGVRGDIDIPCKLARYFAFDEKQALEYATMNLSVSIYYLYFRCLHQY